MAKTYSFGRISSIQRPDDLPFQRTTLDNNAIWCRSKSEGGRGASSVPVVPIYHVYPHQPMNNELRHKIQNDVAPIGL